MTSDDQILAPAGDAKPDSAPASARPGVKNTFAETYAQRLADLKVKAETNPHAAEAMRLAESLEESNVLAIYRLMQLFSSEKVVQKVEESLALYKKAKEEGPTAYEPSENGTPVATKKGLPRTPGGIFFFLMREYAMSMGLRFEALYLPQPPNGYNNRPPQNRGDRTKRDKPQNQNRPDRGAPTAETAKPVPAKSIEPAKAATPKPEAPKAAATPAPKPEPTKGTADAPPVVDKPSRAKITVIGRLIGAPKLKPQGLEGLLELVIETEMSQSLPKGLPNLGKSRVVIWCTQKQFDKIKSTLTPQSRLLIEGEPAPAVNADFKPFIKVICLKLSTLDLEQAQRVKQQADK